MNTTQRTIARVNYRAASLLDAVAVLAAKLLPIDGAGVIYTHGLPWSVGTFKENTSRVVFVGGYEACVDFRTAGKALASGN